MIALALAVWSICGQDVVIQSHRGAGVLAADNTLAAFELGWKLGTYPEADVRTTKDGVIVAFHDSNFGRVVKNASPELRKKGVADLTAKELSALDVGGPIPHIRQVLAALAKEPARRLYLDFKNVELQQLAALVKAHKVQRQILLASTTYEKLVAWKSLVPESGTLHWMGGTEADLTRRLAELRAVGFAGITQLQVHIHPPGHASALGTAFLRTLGDELRKRGILFQALPWGASDPESYTRLLELGVESFATDHPDVALKAVRAFCEKEKP